METTVTIGFIVGIVGFFLTVLSFIKSRDKDTRTDAHKNAIIETKLDSIGLGVEQIRIDIRAQEQRVNALTEQSIRNEESIKQAHKRLDEAQIRIERIEDRVDERERE